MIKNVKIGPYDFTVQYQKDLRGTQGNALYGQTDFNDFSILLHDEIPATKEPVTLLHEIAHAICFTAGVHKDAGHSLQVEERYVDAIATGMAAVLRDNPKLVKYLNENL